MRSVWFCVRRQHLGTVKPVKFFRILPKKGMAQNRLGRITVFLMVQTVRTAKIRDSALRGHARTAKENDVIALINNLL